MLALNNEFPLRSCVSEELDQSYAAEKASKPDESCPFCSQESAWKLKTMEGTDVSWRIGFFICKSCNETWYGLING